MEGIIKTEKEPTPSELIAGAVRELRCASESIDDCLYDIIEPGGLESKHKSEIVREVLEITSINEDEEPIVLDFKKELLNIITHTILIAEEALENQSWHTLNSLYSLQSRALNSWEENLLTANGRNETEFIQAIKKHFDGLLQIILLAAERGADEPRLLFNLKEL